MKWILFSRIAMVIWFIKVSSSITFHHGNSKVKKLKKQDWIALGTNLVIILIGFGLALAGGYQGATLGSAFPVFAFVLLIAFVIQWLAFIPAFLKQTEIFYDLIGAVAHSTVIILAVLLTPIRNIRTYILLVIILLWAGRLGFFLFRRILRAGGKDGRFDDIKPNALSFFRAWTLQGLWISFTQAAALAAITATSSTTLNIWGWLGLIVGLLIWILGYAFEAIADYQKSQFNKNPENKGKFIDVGLWAISRHPNYFGEITMWIGIAIIALPTLVGWRIFTLISPIFVALLITKISGVPMLEKRADEKWGGQADYEQYKENTPVLIPKFSR